ncbi:MAG: DUF1294 domain-containing protein [Clostridia bacterium]|nr:DUF1294 domain-containing protein [Clostridia bacterium]
MGKVLICYFTVINLLSVIVCTIDKIKATRHSWRISEKTLWVFSLIGGSVGMYLTMKIIRHKTLHKSFMIGLPVLIALQIAFILILTKLYTEHIILV